MSKLAHSNQETMNEIDRRRAIEDGNEDCVGERKTWKQERPAWCPHSTCRYRMSSQAKLCFGELPTPEEHDGDENTHRMCIRGAKDDGEWTFDLQINRGDGHTFYRLLSGLFGFGKRASTGEG